MKDKLDRLLFFFIISVIAFQAYKLGEWKVKEFLEDKKLGFPSYIVFSNDCPFGRLTHGILSAGGENYGQWDDLEFLGFPRCSAPPESFEGFCQIMFMGASLTPIGNAIYDGIIVGGIAFILFFLFCPIDRRYTYLWMIFHILGMVIVTLISCVNRGILLCE